MDSLSYLKLYISSKYNLEVLDKSFSVYIYNIFLELHDSRFIINDSWELDIVATISM